MPRKRSAAPLSPGSLANARSSPVHMSGRFPNMRRLFNDLARGRQTRDGTAHESTQIQGLPLDVSDANGTQRRGVSSWLSRSSCSDAGPHSGDSACAVPGMCDGPADDTICIGYASSNRGPRWVPASPRVVGTNAVSPFTVGATSTDSVGAIHCETPPLTPDSV